MSFFDQPVNLVNAREIYEKGGPASFPSLWSQTNPKIERSHEILDELRASQVQFKMPITKVPGPKWENLGCELLQTLRKKNAETEGGEEKKNLVSKISKFWGQTTMLGVNETGTGDEFQLDARPISGRLHSGIAVAEAAAERLAAKFGREGEAGACTQASWVKDNLSPFRSKLRAALLSPPSSPLRSLSIVFGGTSVTAGHDNKFEESYPFFFKRFLECSFQAAGLTLRVRNAAQGFNQGLPYGLCSSSYLGLDADLVFWEMNHLGLADKDGVMDELAMRNLMQGGNNPAFIFVSEGPMNGIDLRGSRTSACTTCRKNADIYHAGQMCPSALCNHIPCTQCPETYNRNKNGTFFQPSQDMLIAHYAAQGTGAVDVEECVGPRSDQWDYSGTKLMYVAKQKDFGSEWHPGPYGHELMGMVMAYKILMELKDVLKELLKTAMSPDSLQSKPFIPPPLPPPLVCPPSICLTPSHCATTMEPHVPLHFTSNSSSKDFENPGARFPRKKKQLMFKGVEVGPRSMGKSDLLGFHTMLHPTSAPLLDFRTLCSKESECPGKIRKVQISWGHIVEATHRNAWVVSLMETTRNAVTKALDHKTKYIDRKYVLMGTGSSGTLKLKFTGVSASRHMFLCEGPCTGRCPLYRARLSTDADYFIDGMLIKNTKRKQSLTYLSTNNATGVIGMGEWCILVTSPISLQGEHVLSITPKTKKILMITMISWF